ncbi:MAG: energy-coupling factor transporter transmembrane component T [Sporolactobacillus sp.]
MSRGLTVGQYVPGHSLLHRLDPRVKIVLTFLFILLVFLSRSTASLVFLVALFILLVAFGRLSPLRVLRAVRPLLPVIVLSSLINIFYVPGEALFAWWILHVTREGLVVGIGLAVRLSVLIAGCSLLTYTTSLNALALGFEQLLMPLKRLRVPVGELALILTITLRFLPTLAEEVERIIDAQKARGAQIGTGHVLNRICGYFPVILPLFMSAFRRAFELTNAIECRCYHGDAGRTRLIVLHTARRDWLAAGVFMLLLGTGLALNAV